jgi:acetyltransferase-like isoleucine patch superfamily enzyme
MRHLHAARKKFFKMAAKSFPLNSVRVRALRAAGYTVGRRVYIGEELHVTDELYRRGGTLVIGDRVAISQRVLIVLSSHANNSRLTASVEPVLGHVTIGDDAWIGASVTILPNVTIGEAAIVGAGSIVTHDVPPGTVVAGNPARVVRRLDESISLGLEENRDTGRFDVPQGGAGRRR